jgi:hypothetical protein
MPSKVDTELLNLMFLAEKRRISLSELLHGVSTPLSAQEYILWMAYYKYKAAEEEKASKKGSSGKGSRGSQEEQQAAKPTMGQQKR